MDHHKNTRNIKGRRAISLSDERDFSSELDDLERIDWEILQNKDFRRDNDDLGKLERYQAEALVHRHLPTASLLGVVCYNDPMVEAINKLLEGTKVNLKVIPKRGWYF
jgi:hypothetical protein